jgi:hypothetical protein
MSTQVPKSLFPAIEKLDEVAVQLRKSDLLDGFIAANLRAVPNRADRSGVPRGTSLPFPAKKKRAALLHLRLDGDLPDLKALAREARVSYSLLGKWRTEARFRELVDQYTQDFAVFVLAWVHEWVNDSFIPSTFLDIPRALEVISHLGAIERWSPKLRKTIGAALQLSKGKDMHPSIRIVRGLVGLKIMKDLKDAAKLRESYGTLREQVRQTVEPAFSRMQAAIRTGDLALLADHVTMLEALLKPVLDQEYWPL